MIFWGENLMANSRTVSIARTVLSKEIGWTWPIFLVRSAIGGNALFRMTHWAAPAVTKEEARYPKSMSLAAGIYLGLKQKFGQERALAIMRRMLVPIGEANSRQFFDTLDLSNLSGIERFMVFKKKMEETPEHRYTQREYIRVDDTTCHYIIKRCLVYDFFSEVGTPELTRSFCDADQPFFLSAFPDLEFSRGDSWENTMAFGKDHCEYLTTKRA